LRMDRQRTRIRFTPVRLKARHDGWTPDRQFRFIAELQATRSIGRACAAVGMSRASAYALRDRPQAPGGFAFAWRRALAPERAGRKRLMSGAPARLGGRRHAKVDEVVEVEGPPNSLGPVRRSSSASTRLQALLAQLRGLGEGGDEDCRPTADVTPSESA
jgi:hypothetical protein